MSVQGDTLGIPDWMPHARGSRRPQVAAGGETYPIPDLQFHYLPREICIHIKINGPPEISTAIMTNQELMKLLNPPLKAALANVMPAGGSELNQDLSPSPILWQRCSIPDPGPLLELTRWPMERRFVQFNSDGTTSDALHFFAVEVNPIDPLFSEQERAGTIRDLVNLINTKFRPFSPLVSGNAVPAWTVIAATPNWLASPSDNTDGGNPGTPPDPFPGPLTGRTFQFGHSQLQTLVGRQRGKGLEPANVVVAVLDTSPTSAEVTNAAASPATGNPLMNVVATPGTGVGIEERLSVNFNALQQSDFAHLADFVPNWGQLLSLWQTAGATYRPILRANRYATVDHGLFIAGIIKDIAPRADVHLMRVLDTSGMGDLLTLTLVMSLVPGMLVRKNGVDRRLIINLSLSLDVPPPDLLRAFWFPKAVADLSPPPGQETVIQEHLAFIQSSFTGVLDWLLAEGHLIVASVGNDALGLPGPPRPVANLPARYPGVLSVAAVNRSGNPASYSNQITATGIAVYGGDADINPGTGAVEIRVSPSGIPDGVVGIFLSPTLPFNAGPNMSGWAYWAGTSFAAPVISAIAADLCMTGPIQNGQLIGDIQGFASSSATGLGPKGGVIVAFQV